jgi:hypothetical protein
MITEKRLGRVSMAVQLLMMIGGLIAWLNSDVIANKLMGGGMHERSVSFYSAFPIKGGEMV